MEFKNDLKFDGSYLSKDVSDGETYSISEALNKIWNDLYVNGGNFVGQQGPKGEPGLNGQNGLPANITDITLTDPSDDTMIKINANTAMVITIVKPYEKELLVISNPYEDEKEYRFGDYKLRAVKISGDDGKDGFDGTDGKDSKVPGPKGEPGKDGTTYGVITKTIVGDTDIMVPALTAVIVLKDFNGKGIASYVNSTTSDTVINSSILSFIDLKGDKGDTGEKGDTGDKGDTSNVKALRYTSGDFNDDQVLEPHTLLVITATYTDAQGPQSFIGTFSNDSDTQVNLNVNLTNTAINWLSVQGLKGLDSTVPGPKGEEGNKGDQGPKGDPGEAVKAKVLKLTNPKDSDGFLVDPNTLVYIFKYTNGESEFGFYFNNTDETQNPRVRDVEFVSTTGATGPAGATGPTGPTGPTGKASKIESAYLTNPKDDDTVYTPAHTTTITFVIQTTDSNMGISKMGSVVNNFDNPINTKVSDIKFTSISSNAIIPEPGKNANIQYVEIGESTSSIDLLPHSGYIIKINKTDGVYIGFATNNTDDTVPTSVSSINFTNISGKDGEDGAPGKDGKDGTASVDFVEGDSTLTHTVAPHSKLQVFDATNHVIAVYINDTDTEVTKQANFTYKPGSGSGGSGLTKLVPGPDYSLAKFSNQQVQLKSDDAVIISSYNLNKGHFDLTYNFDEEGSLSEGYTSKKAGYILSDVGINAYKRTESVQSPSVANETNDSTVIANNRNNYTATLPTIKKDSKGFNTVVKFGEWNNVISDTGIKEDLEKLIAKPRGNDSNAKSDFLVNALNGSEVKLPNFNLTVIDKDKTSFPLTLKGPDKMFENNYTSYMGRIIITIDGSDINLYTATYNPDSSSNEWNDNYRHNVYNDFASLDYFLKSYNVGLSLPKYRYMLVHKEGLNDIDLTTAEFFNSSDLNAARAKAKTDNRPVVVVPSIMQPWGYIYNQGNVRGVSFIAFTPSSTSVSDFVTVLFKTTNDTRDSYIGEGSTGIYPVPYNDDADYGLLISLNNRLKELYTDDTKYVFKGRTSMPYVTSPNNMATELSHIAGTLFELNVDVDVIDTRP